MDQNLCEPIFFLNIHTFIYVHTFWLDHQFQINHIQYEKPFKFSFILFPFCYFRSVAKGKETHMRNVKRYKCCIRFIRSLIGIAIDDIHSPIPHYDK